MSARLLVVQHEPDAPLAWFGEWWAGTGVEVDVVRGDLGERVPARLGHDGLVVLGGAMGAHDDEVHPWLAPTKALIRDAVAREAPVLGICLGHQLTAAALGGRVGRNPAGRTVGLAPLRLGGGGVTDPLLGASGGLPAIHYNDDVVLDLPRAAVVLATLPDGRPQAVRFGVRAWGVQFHPEASPEVFASWVDADPPAVPGELVAEVTAARDRLRSAWRPLAERFAAIAGSPTSASA